MQDPLNLQVWLSGEVMGWCILGRHVPVGEIWFMGLCSVIPVSHGWTWRLTIDSEAESVVALSMREDVVCDPV
jgi:hypothetical protein